MAARDLAPFGITVNAINPAAALTRMVTGSVDRARERGLDEARARRMLDVAQDPRDVADVAAYLCSKESGDVNGRFFFVQGGQVGFFDPIAVGQSLVKDGRWTPTSSPPPSPSSTSPRWRASTSGGEVAALSLFCRGVSTARARVRLQS